jgi:hypothetical protein
VRRAHRREHPAAHPRGRDNLDPVLDHVFHRADAADGRLSAVLRQELAGAGDAPTALRIVADVAGAGREDRRSQRIRILGRDENHPLIQIQRRRRWLQNRLDGQPQRVRQRVGHAG